MIRYKYNIFGIVQGVGFRPFIYKLASQLGLSGYVLNNSKGVKVEIEGFVKDIELFDERLISESPPLARIDNFEKHPIDLQRTSSFDIIETTSKNSKTTLVSTDVKVCNECMEDVKDTKKYKNYFATNCTNCGPRYSIIKTVPYDRVNTSMSEFVMCDSCKEEYSDPNNRRYHAQPISCNNCGPKLNLVNKQNEIIDTENIYKTVSDFVKNGKILAIKGIGGFHIVCDASNDEVINKLRLYKNRPTKPFALMCKDITQVKSIANITNKEEQLLLSKEAPIVILETKEKNNINKNIAPNIDKIGCFLPYTPLHIILFEYLSSPIIATSANLSNEPIIINKNDILEKLPFVDFVLDFNRDIINAVDDSIVQVIDNDIQILRGARGYYPKVIKLSKKCDKKILAVGANQKNTISIVIEDSIITSPYIGDLNSLKAFEYFKRTVNTFKKFYDFTPEIIICDKHPNYETTKWAKEQNIELIQVQHHLAHIYGCKAEFKLTKNYLGFSFDGTGYGDDKVNGEAREGTFGYGTLWGGEVFVGDKRKYHFKSIKLLGGEKAIKEPRRVVLSMLFDRFTLDEILTLDLALIKTFKLSEIKILHKSYTNDLNAPLSSSVGRLFDAIASLTNILHFQEFEGEAGLLCEQNYNSNIVKTFDYEIVNGVIDIKYDFFIQDIVSIFINTLGVCRIEI